MSKPLGIRLSMIDGLPRYYVSPIDRVADQIYDAVREAIGANMTPDQFRQEAADAWEQQLKDDAAYARKMLTR